MLDYPVNKGKNGQSIEVSSFNLNPIYISSMSSTGRRLDRLRINAVGTISRWGKKNMLLKRGAMTQIYVRCKVQSVAYMLSACRLPSIDSVHSFHITRAETQNSPRGSVTGSAGGVDLARSDSDEEWTQLRKTLPLVFQ